jgi:hypothetical protein
MKRPLVKISSFQFVTPVQAASRRSFPYLPGAILVAVGACVLIAPKLLFYAVGSLLITFGLLFCFLTWKIMRVIHRFSGLRDQIQGRVEILRDTPSPQSRFRVITEEDDGKYTVH